VYASHWVHFVGGIDPKVDAMIQQGAAVADFQLIFLNNGPHSLSWTPEKATDEQNADTTPAIVRGFKMGAPQAKLFWISTAPHTARVAKPRKPVNALGDNNPVGLRIDRIAEQVMKEEGVGAPTYHFSWLKTPGLLGARALCKTRFANERLINGVRCVCFRGADV